MMILIGFVIHFNACVIFFVPSIMGFEGHYPIDHPRFEVFGPTWPFLRNLTNVEPSVQYSWSIFKACLEVRTFEPDRHNLKSCWFLKTPWLKRLLLFCIISIIQFLYLYDFEPIQFCIFPEFQIGISLILIMKVIFSNNQRLLHICLSSVMVRLRLNAQSTCG